MMKEDDIRPRALRRENAALRREDVQRLLQRRGEFVEVACPACAEDVPEAAFSKDGFAYHRCGRCATVYVNPRPTREMLLEFYATAESIRHWGRVLFPATEMARRAQIFAPRARRVADLCRRMSLSGGRLLDVGAGFGTFCEEVAKLEVFDEVLAVETAPDMVAACRAKGLAVLDHAVEQADLPKATVITAFELIEHLFDPGAFLRACAAALSPGGLLILTTPNVLGFEVLALGQASRTFGAPEHLNYFHPVSLRGLLFESRFEVLECATPGALDVELVRQAVAEGHEVAREPWFQSILHGDEPGDEFQKLLVRLGWSAHLSIAARAR